MSAWSSNYFLLEHYRKKLAVFDSSAIVRYYKWQHDLEQSERMKNKIIVWSTQNWSGHTNQRAALGRIWASSGYRPRLKNIAGACYYSGFLSMKFPSSDPLNEITLEHFSTAEPFSFSNFLSRMRALPDGCCGESRLDGNREVLIFKVTHLPN